MITRCRSLARRSRSLLLLDEECAFEGEVVEAQLAHEPDEKRRGHGGEVVWRQLAEGASDRPLRNSSRRI